MRWHRNDTTVSIRYIFKPSWQDVQKLHFNQTTDMHLYLDLPEADGYCYLHNTGKERALICCNQCWFHWLKPSTVIWVKIYMYKKVIVPG